jgi:HK97 family phage prohead protease
MENRRQETNEQPQSESAMERRYFNVESRAKSENGEMRIGGYGAMFNTYANLGWFVETIESGFFDGCDMEQCACLFNHDNNIILGRKRSGTLTLKVDANGLDYDCKPPKTRADVYESIERGDVYQSSFGFTVKKARWEEWTREMLIGKIPDDEIDALMYNGTVSVRVLEKGKSLFDVSPVTYPAYTDTSVAKRSLESSLVDKLPALREVFDEAKEAIREIIGTPPIEETPTPEPTQTDFQALADAELAEFQQMQLLTL